MSQTGVEDDGSAGSGEHLFKDAMTGDSVF